MSISTSTTNPAILPLLSTTSSLSFAAFEYIVYDILLKSSLVRPHKRAVARTISLWWANSIPLAPLPIFSLGLASLVTGIRAARALPQYGRERYVAIAGTCFAVGHFAFAPTILRVIENMARAYERVGLWKAEAEERGQTQEEIADEKVLEGQSEWLRVHAVRTFTVDLPAFACFAWLIFKR